MNKVKSSGLSDLAGFGGEPFDARSACSEKSETFKDKGLEVRGLYPHRSRKSESQ
jgi:hypothetical protein